MVSAPGGSRGDVGPAGVSGDAVVVIGCKTAEKIFRGPMTAICAGICGDNESEGDLN